jgi:hypothetical protein
VVVWPTPKDVSSGWGVNGRPSRVSDLEQELSKQLVVRLTNAVTSMCAPSRGQLAIRGFSFTLFFTLPVALILVPCRTSFLNWMAGH